MTPFRKLTSAETAALEALGNSAEDWSKVLVSEDFKPFQLLQSHLEGDVEIAAEARIVRSRVANYRIGTGSLVEGVTALECRRRSAFGNGVGVATMALADDSGDQELREEYERIAGLLATLPEEQAEVIRLKTSDSLTFARIAEITGTTEATVKSRFRYGIGKLRKLINH